jgi:histidinol dehydrogenase
MKEVSALIDRLKSGGEDEVKKQVKDFDDVDLGQIRVPSELLQRAEEKMKPELRQAIETAISRVRGSSQAHMPDNLSHSPALGATIDTLFAPVERAAVYAPGGKAAYPSSVIMSVVPAQTAGVKDIILFSPPNTETGLPDETVLATASILGISDVFAIGGVAAVYVAAYGLPEIGVSKADVLVGPGNVYTTAAKRLLSHRIGLDSEAGPTEIMILADSSAKPELVASDLISQAEHDENAAAICLTTSIGLAELVAEAIQELLPNEVNRQRIQTALEGEQSAIVVVDDVKEMTRIANIWGAEHLSIQTARPRELSDTITNAGAIFLGAFTPVSLADYTAGSNHVLPTGNASRFSSGLSIYTFLRTREVVEYSEAAFFDVSPHAALMAKAESLRAHASALSIRKNYRSDNSGR